MNHNHIGTTLAITGSITSVVGTLANNISLDHILAMQLWMISNPLLLAWAYGSYRKWWNGALSIEALAVMYLIFTITNLYGLVIG